MENGFSCPFIGKFPGHVKKQTMQTAHCRPCRLKICFQKYISFLSIYLFLFNCGVNDMCIPVVTVILHCGPRRSKLARNSDMCVRGYHISRCHSDMCIPVHITSDICIPSNMAASEMCIPYPLPHPSKQL